METTINQRIEALIKFFNTNKNQLALRLNMSNPSMTHLVNGTGSPSFKTITKLLEYYPSVNSEWLIRGNGNMIKEENVLAEPMVTYNKYTEDKLDLMSKLIECQEEKDRYRHLLEANNISPAQLSA